MSTSRELTPKMHKPDRRIFALVGAIAGLMLVAFAGGVICDRLFLTIDGVIESRQPIRVASGPYRYFTVYTIQSETGQLTNHSAEGNDGSIARDLPVGTHVTKRRGELAYWLNGRKVDDFPARSYGSILALGGISFLVSIVLLCQGASP